MMADPAARRRLRLLSHGLLGYSVVGLVVAVFAIVALVVGLGRVSALGDRMRDDVGGVAAVLSTTGDVLERASASAEGIDGTISSSTTALATAAADLRGIAPLLRDIEARANAINILGSQPLAPLAGQFGAIASQLGDLDAQVAGIAANLELNRTALSTTAESLLDLAGRTRSLAARLGDEELSGAIDDVRWLMVAMLGIGGLGAAVPAVGALLGGLWLQRELR